VLVRSCGYSGHGFEAAKLGEEDMTPNGVRQEAGKG